MIDGISLYFIDKQLSLDDRDFSKVLPLIRGGFGIEILLVNLSCGRNWEKTSHTFFFLNLYNKFVYVILRLLLFFFLAIHFIDTHWSWDLLLLWHTLTIPKLSPWGRHFCASMPTASKPQNLINSMSKEAHQPFTLM